MIIENRTPHAVALDRGAKGGRQILHPVYPSVRAQLVPGPVEDDLVAGIPLHRPVTVAGITGLPPPREGVLVLVSTIAAITIGALHPERTDVIHPSTDRSAVRRDDQGVVAIAALVRAS